MIKDINFVMHNYAFLTAGPRSLLFPATTALDTERLRSKALLWDKSLRGNFQPSVTELVKLLVTNILLQHVHRLTAEANVEGLTVLLATI